MKGDYLWDRSGPPSVEVARLERALGTLGLKDPPPPLQVPLVQAARRRPAGVMAALAVAASIVVSLVGWMWWNRGDTTPSLAVTRVSGTPTVGSRAVTDRGDLAVGHWLETDAQARASVDVADIGRVDVDPGSRLGLLSTRPGDYRLHLSRGTLHAVIWAPPGQFFVETPSSTAVDLGCAYTLTVDDDGTGVVRVTLGWVGFEWHGRESFIPAGAMCLTRPGLGPGTPHYEDTSEAFRSALDAIDFGGAPPDVMTGALTRVLAEARQRDVVTLWHLLTRVDPPQRDRVFDRLAAFVPPPSGVTREGIRAGRRDMLDAWWDQLGLGTAGWWRTWKQQWRDK